VGALINLIVEFDHQDSDLYEQYLHLRYKIFYSEFNWHSLNVDVLNQITLSENTDEQAIFFGYLVNGNLIAIVRLVSSTKAVPYQEIYENYIEQKKFPEKFVVINSLAVEKPFRGKRQYQLAKSDIGTIADLLMEHVENYSIRHGMNAIVFTAGCNASSKFFDRHDYTRISDCYTKPWAPTKLVDYLVKL